MIMHILQKSQVLEKFTFHEDNIYAFVYALIFL